MHDSIMFLREQMQKYIHCDKCDFCPCAFLRIHSQNTLLAMERFHTKYTTYIVKPFHIIFLQYYCIRVYYFNESTTQMEHVDGQVRRSDYWNENLVLPILSSPWPNRIWTQHCPDRIPMQLYKLPQLLHNHAKRSDSNPSERELSRTLDLTRGISPNREQHRDIFPNSTAPLHGSSNTRATVVHRGSR